MILTNEQLRKLQLKETEILKEIDRLCRKHKIYYSLMYGTLIGAIRHKGFIPWDDDIDILMTRDNFDKFLSVLNELDDKFFYIDSYTNKHYGLRFGKVMMKNTIMQEKITSKKVPCGIFIDIFVVEKTSLDEKKQIKQFNDYWTLRRICLRRSHYITKNNPISRFIFNLMGCLFKLIPYRYLTKKDKEIKSRFNTLEDYKWINLELTEKDFSLAIIEKDVFIEYIDVDFEGNKFMVIKDYDKILIPTYGDYMQLPSEEDRNPHHYVENIDFGETK